MERDFQLLPVTQTRVFFDLTCNACGQQVRTWGEGEIEAALAQALYYAPRCCTRQADWYVGADGHSHRRSARADTYTIWAADIIRTTKLSNVYVGPPTYTDDFSW